MIDQKKKKLIINNLLDKIKRSQAIYFANFSGLSVPAMNQLRSQLKEQEGEAKIAKKTLIDVAFTHFGQPVDLRKQFPGSLMLNFAFTDPLGIANVIWKFSKKNEKLQILGGIINGKLISKEEVVQLAQIPSRDVLLGRLVGSLVSPLQQLAYVLNGNMQKLVVALGQIRESKQ